MNLKRVVLIIFIGLSASILSAFEPGDCYDVEEKGELKVLEGILDSKDGRVMLQVGKIYYELIIGPGMLNYNDGDKIEIEGWVYDMQILPTKVKIGGVEVLIGPGRGRCRSFGRGKRNYKGQ